MAIYYQNKGYFNFLSKINNESIELLTKKLWANLLKNRDAKLWV